MASTSDARKYDVFLSFRGEDTRQGFTEHLYQKLKSEGFKVFKDDLEPERGITIWRKLLTAIEESKTAVVVISPKFASSTWCLDEVLKIFECMEARNTIFPVFCDVDPRVVRHQLDTFAEAFENHRQRFEDQDKVQRWKESLTKLANLVGWTSKDYTSEAELIIQVVGTVWDKVDPAFTLLGSSEKYAGIIDELKQMRSLLELEVNDVRYTGICGLGGIGKTYIAKLFYERIAYNFDVSCFLTVSRSHNIAHLQEQLISSISKAEYTDWGTDSYSAVSMIKHCFSNKKVLLVLDDVDRPEQVENLAGNKDWFGLGSRIIITTRDERLLIEADACLKIDMNANAVRLFCQKAFKKETPEVEYVELTNYAIECCCGLPILLKVLGSIFYGKGVDIWKSTLDKLYMCLRLQGGDISVLINDLIKICYEEGLNESEKKIFLDIACFFKGEHKERVITILESQFGCSRASLNALVEKSFLEISNERTVEMHDLMQEFGHEIGRRGSRLWFHDEIMEVLAENKGTEAIEGIILDLTHKERFPYKQKIDFDPRAFSKMKNLRFLIVRGSSMRLPLISKHLPDSIRHFEWSCC